MLIFAKIAELQAFLSEKKTLGLTIGFIPTMGALHQGHISLIEAGKRGCKLSVCSIFVNPTQFNDKSDLSRYPRTPEKDIELLKKANCDVLFMPTVEEIYPEIEETRFDFGNLDKILEGEHRPGHFKGVAQVVKRLFEIVRPDKAFFGSKDYQQVLIVKALVKQLNAPIEIVPCPILRDADGLAMSSRNTLLNDEERKVASLIPKMMNEAKLIVNTRGINAAKDFIKNQTSLHDLMKLDYYEVCDEHDLKQLNDKESINKAVSLIAVFVGKIRLIDNLKI